MRVYIHAYQILPYFLPQSTTYHVAPHKNSQGNTQTMVLLCPKFDCRAEWKAFKMASGVDKGEHLRFSAKKIGQRKGPQV